MGTESTPELTDYPTASVYFNAYIVLVLCCAVH